MNDQLFSVKNDKIANPSGNIHRIRFRSFMMDTFDPDYWRRHPAFRVVADIAEQFAWTDWPAALDYYQQLSSSNGSIRFADIQGVSYEQHIAETGAVPTRYANWHDYFNALIWHAFPRSKRVLNDLHQLARAGSSQRGSRRDAATLFDESGVIFACSDATMIDALKQMNWQTLFVEKRAQWTASVRVLIFGHGVLDKLRAPYIGLTAHAQVLPVSSQMLSASSGNCRTLLDQQLAEHIRTIASNWTPADLCPLPLLGIPGWWPANTDPAFYQNTHYFRAQRTRQGKSDSSN